MTATISEKYIDHIRKALPFCLTKTDFKFGKKHEGKVRDIYDLGNKLVLITTDRQSAFDRVLAAIPYKGQVLNLTSAWWFEQTQHIIPNHLITIPDPNVTIAKKCDVFPVEFVVRGYITGSTSTSLWKQYEDGIRNYCGNHLPDGLVKNEKLYKPIITPTTKDKKHDRPITPDEIIKERLMTQDDWNYASFKAMSLYEYGVKVAKEHGLILVDTKYEMGKDADGKIVLVDEIHTPDSSRYWDAHSYEKRFMAGLEPENFDKEFLRLWFVDHCDPYHDKELPQAPEDLIVKLSSKYIQLFEMITGSKFHFPQEISHTNERILRHVAGYL